MANNVNRQVNIYIASGEAEKAYNRLIAKEKQLKDELVKATDPKIIARLQNELGKLAEPIDRAGKKVRGELEPSFRDLQKTVNALGNRLKQMSTSDADYTKILVQYQAANAALREQQGHINQIKEAEKGMGSFMGPLLANLATKAIDTLKDLGMQALKNFLEIQGVERAFNRLNAPDLLDNLRKATKGTVTDLELMKRAVAADNFQIPINKLGTLLEFAQGRARETGQSVDYLVDSIVTGIARKSPLILDNLGINIQRVNEQFKKTGDFAQAAFNVVDEELAKAGPMLDTYADKWDRLKTTISNFSTDVVSGLASIGENIYDATILQFGGIEAKTQLLIEESRKSIAKENEQARQQELSVIKKYQEEYAKVDKAGRDKILSQMRTEIKAIETQEAFAYFEGRDRLAQILGIKLDLWKKYFKDIGASLKSGDTIANLQKEIQLTTELRDNAIIGSDQFNDAKKKLKELQDRMDQLLGKGKKPKENLAEQFREQLSDIADELDTFNSEQFRKDLTANEKKYAAISRRLREALEKDQLTEQEFGELSLLTADSRERERSEIIRKWRIEVRKKNLEEEKKTAKELRELDERRMKALLEHQEIIAKYIGESADKALGRLKYRQEIDIMIATGKDRLRLRIEQLENERKAEIAAAEKTSRDVADINKKYDFEIHQTRLEFTKGRIGEILDYIGQIAATFDQISQQQTQREQQQLEDDRKANDRKKENYRRQLDGKQLTQKEYDKKVRELDKQQEEKEKQIRIRQFNRDKVSALASAAINIAEAITKALPDPFRIALVATVGAIQLGLIAAQKPPKFGKGGRLHGPLHSEGGMPVINPRTGHKVMEVEGDEVILSRNTVRNNSQLIDQLLYNSLHKNGAPLKPLWRVTNPSYINIPALSNSIHRVRMYANGGVIDAPVGSDTSINDQETIMLAMEISRLNNHLDRGIKAITVLSELEATQERRDRIVNDATMR